MQERHHTPLAGLTTMRVGGPAARLVTAETTDELVDAVRDVDDAQEPLLLLGGGSNLVVADAGFPGTVVRVASRGIAVESAGHSAGVLLRVAGGEVWDEVASLAVAEGWSGVEALSGIPGSAGATPVQNVGAYGQEVAQTIVSVRVWDRAEQRVRELANGDCGFTYRHSLFKASARYVVLDVLFRLGAGPLSEPVRYADVAAQLDVRAGDRVPLDQMRAAVLAQRRKRGMVLDADDHDTWSCGSFFTNPILGERELEELQTRLTDRLGARAPLPGFTEGDGSVKTSAAWLIEQAGFTKGYGLPGPAALSTKHTLAITNRGTATARHVAELAREIHDCVADAFGISLVTEPVFVGHAL